MELMQGNQRRSGGNSGTEPVSAIVFTRNQSINGIPQWEHPKMSSDSALTKGVAAEPGGKDTKRSPSAVSAGRRQPRKAGKTHSRQLKVSSAKSPKSPIKSSLKAMLDSRGKNASEDIVLPSFFAPDDLHARPKIEEVVVKLQCGRDMLFSSGKLPGKSALKNSNSGTHKESCSSIAPEKAKWCPPAPLCESNDDTDAWTDKHNCDSVNVIPSNAGDSIREDLSRPKAPDRVASLKCASLNASNSSLLGIRVSANESFHHNNMSSLHMSLDMMCSLNDAEFEDDDPDYHRMLQEQENEMIRLAMENSMQDFDNSAGNFDQISRCSGDGSATSNHTSTSRGGGRGRKYQASGDTGERKRLSIIDEPVIGDNGHEEDTIHYPGFCDDKHIWEDLVEKSSTAALQCSSATTYSVRERALAEIVKICSEAPCSDS